MHVHSRARGRVERGGVGLGSESSQLGGCASFRRQSVPCARTPPARPEAYALRSASATRQSREQAASKKCFWLLGFCEARDARPTHRCLDTGNAALLHSHQDQVGQPASLAPARLGSQPCKKVNNRGRHRRVAVDPLLPLTIAAGKGRRPVFQRPTSRHGRTTAEGCRPISLRSSHEQRAHLRALLP